MTQMRFLKHKANVEKHLMEIHRNEIWNALKKNQAAEDQLHASSI